MDTKLLNMLASLDPGMQAKKAVLDTLSRYIVKNLDDYYSLIKKIDSEVCKDINLDNTDSYHSAHGTAIFILSLLRKKIDDLLSGDLQFDFIESEELKLENNIIETLDSLCNDTSSQNLETSYNSLIFLVENFREIDYPEASHVYKVIGTLLFHNNRNYDAINESCVFAPEVDLKYSNLDKKLEPNSPEDRKIMDEYVSNFNCPPYVVDHYERKISFALKLRGLDDEHSPDIPEPQLLWLMKSYEIENIISVPDISSNKIYNICLYNGKYYVLYITHSSYESMENSYIIEGLLLKPDDSDSSNELLILYVPKTSKYECILDDI